MRTRTTTRWARAAGALVLVAAGLAAGTTAAQAAADDQTQAPGVASAPALNSMFNTYANGAGCARWSGGDGTSSILLSDDPANQKRLWSFSDTYVGPTASRTTAQMINNSSILQQGTSLVRTHTGGDACTASKPTGPAVSAASGGEWLWNGDGLTVNNAAGTGKDVVRFHYRVKRTSELFDLTGWATTRQAVTQFDKDVPADRTARNHATVQNADGNKVLWGKAILREGAWVYVYGSAGRSCLGCGVDVFVARTSPANIDTPGNWTFWNGSTWASGMGAATPLPGLGTIGDNFSVTKVNGKFWLVAHEKVFSGGDIRGFVSSTVTGFKDAAAMRLYTPPESMTRSDTYKYHYDARVHPDMGAAYAGKLVISYNVNSMAVNVGCRSAVDLVPSIYRPRFITVPLSSLDSTKVGKLSSRETGLPGASTASAAAGTDTAWYFKSLYGGSCPKYSATKKVTVTPTTTTAGNVTLNWSDYGSGMKYYVTRCNRACDEEVSWDLAWPAFVTGRTFSESPITLEYPQVGKKTYHYRVTPYGVHEGLGSTLAAHTQLSVTSTVLPQTPLAFKALLTGPGAVSLSWSPPNFLTPTGQYQVLRWNITDGQTRSNAVASSWLSTNSMHYTASGLVRGKKYGFAVVARNAGGTGPAASLSVTVPLT